MGRPGTALHWCLTIGCVAALTMAMADGETNDVQPDETDAGHAAAEAQTGEPYVVRYLPIVSGGPSGYHRVWSDGRVDRWQWEFENDGTCDPPIFVGTIIEAVAHPAPVIEANATDSPSFTLEYADGRVDYIAWHPVTLAWRRCTVDDPDAAPFCQGDTDRSGVTDVVDLLTVLADWGVCTGG